MGLMGHLGGRCGRNRPEHCPCEICHGVKTFLAALEKSEMERKLEELRGQVKELKRLRAT